MALDMNEEDVVRWTVKHDAYRPLTDFTDLLRVVGAYYEQYAKASAYLGPWIAKQQGLSMFIPPDSDQLREALGRERAVMHPQARRAFINAVIKFMQETKGKKTLISPNPSSHHSAQFPVGTFSITPCEGVELRDDRGPRKPARLHKLEFTGALEPVYIENFNLTPDQVKFIILRPKLGKLGTASASRWEVLIYKKAHGYLVNHTDSVLSPRYAGII